MNERTIPLDVSKEPASIPTLRIGQHDKSRPILRVQVLDHGEPLDLEGFTVTLEMRVKSKHVFSGSVDGSTATFELDGEIEHGSGFAYVVIESDDARLSTQRFAVEILEGSE